MTALAVRCPVPGHPTLTGQPDTRIGWCDFCWLPYDLDKPTPPPTPPRAHRCTGCRRRYAFLHRGGIPVHRTGTRRCLGSALAPKGQR